MIDAFLETARIVRPLLADPVLTDRWDGPSPLEQMTMGSLAAHTARAVLTVATYLDGPPPEPHADVVDFPGYLANNHVIAANPDSPISIDVRARSDEAARQGWEATLLDFDETLADLDERLPGESGRILAVRNAAMELDTYLLSRVVELVIHGDDLAVGLGQHPPPFPEATLEVVVEALLSVTRSTRAPWDIIRAMTRSERADTGTFRVL